MKRNFICTTAIMTLCLAGLLSGTAQAAVVLFEDFEDNTLTFTSSISLFHDGTNDYFGIVPLIGSPANPVDAYTGFSGANFFAAEDIDDGAGIAFGTQTLSFNVNVTNFEDLTFDGLFAAGGNLASVPAYDSNDGLLVRAQLDGGAFQNLLSFEAVGTTNQQTRLDADFNGTGDAGGFLPTSAAFNGLSIMGTGNNLLLEIVVSSNDGNVEYAFDDITINGNAVAAVPEPGSALAILLFGTAAFVHRRRKLRRAVEA